MKLTNGQPSTKIRAQLSSETVRIIGLMLQTLESQGCSSVIRKDFVLGCLAELSFSEYQAYCLWHMLKFDSVLNKVHNDLQQLLSLVYTKMLGRFMMYDEPKVSSGELGLLGLSLAVKNACNLNDNRSCVFYETRSRLEEWMINSPVEGEKGWKYTMNNLSPIEVMATYKSAMRAVPVVPPLDYNEKAGFIALLEVDENGDKVKVFDEYVVQNKSTQDKKLRPIVQEPKVSQISEKKASLKCSGCVVRPHIIIEIQDDQLRNYREQPFETEEIQELLKWPFSDKKVLSQHSWAFLELKSFDEIENHFQKMCASTMTGSD